ncbi:hypothetical protein [Brachybacterium sp. UNK5269]|uniref:hypothetical protein n=1 Tax=Brachybacterium sp. UNK5269 TaxID=3408576 RepID=UPI003BAEE65D
MSEQNHHADPDPLRPSQAEGEAEENDETSTDPAEGGAAPGSGDGADPDPLRPSQAEG